MRAATLSLALLLLSTACGSDKLTFRGICEGLATRVCDKRDECNPPVSPTCVSDSVAACCAIISDCDIEIEDQELKDGFDACVSAYDDLTCTAFNAGELPQSCE
jgi:hypothetical protein